MTHPIKKIREENNLIQIDLSVILNCTPGFIAQLEKGAKPPSGFFNKLCTQFNLDPEQLKKDIEEYRDGIKNRLTDRRKYW
jgi:transcriptional regulator with XRE-family HTH domain